MCVISSETVRYSVVQYAIFRCNCLKFLVLISLFHVENATHLLLQGGKRKTKNYVYNSFTLLGRRDTYHRFYSYSVGKKKQTSHWRLLSVAYCDTSEITGTKHTERYFDSEQHICGSNAACLEKNSKAHAVAFNKNYTRAETAVIKQKECWQGPRTVVSRLPRYLLERLWTGVLMPC